MWCRTAVEFNFYQGLKIEEKCVNYKKISGCDPIIKGYCSYISDFIRKW